MEVKRIPDVKNKKLDEAKKIFENQNIKYNEEVKEVFSINTKRGYVVKTEPVIDEEYKGEEVIVYVSRLKLLPFFLLCLLIGILLLGVNLGFSDIFTTRAPEIARKGESWVKKDLVSVVRDARMKNDVSYYEYCVTKDKGFKNCKWEKTITKNTELGTTGKWYVYFRAVDTENKKSKISNKEEVWVDNESPLVKDLIKETTDTSILLNVKANDLHSGVYSYFYSINNSKFTKGEQKKLFKDLKPDTLYEIKIKVVDKVGNEVILSTNIKTNKKGETGDNNSGNNSDNGNEDNDSNGSDSDTDNDDNNTDGDDNNSNGGNGTNDDKTTTTTKKPGDKTTTKKTTTTKKPEEVEMPSIDLLDVPSIIKYKESYTLPSHYSFGPSGGIKKCMVGNKEYTNTNQLGFGKHLIVCSATSNKGNITVTASKEVEVKLEEGEDEIWDGWIRLNLYYPENSTNWQWRLGKEGEIRDGYEDTGWQDYTGPILVKLTDVENIYIRYTIDDKVITIPPTGKLLVDIIPNKFTLKDDEVTKVKIICDETADKCEYRVGSGAWKKYTEEFEVGKNTLIEARAIKTDKIYDSDGNYVTDKKRQNTDSVWISEFIPEGSTGGSGSSNGGHGGSIDYVPNPIPGDNGNYTKPKPEGKPSTYLEGPIITNINASEIVEETKIRVNTKEVADKIYVSINYGKWEEYTGEFTVNKNCVIRAYYTRFIDGKKSETSYYYVQNIKVGRKPYVRINATPGSYISELVDMVEVSISGNNYDTLEYSLDGMTYQPYKEKFVVNKNATVYARGTNEYGTTVEKITVTTYKEPVPVEELDVAISVEPEKEDVEGLINKIKVTIDYDPRATKKYYSIGYYGEQKEYNGPFELNSNAVIYAYATKDNGYGRARKRIEYLTTGIAEPIINVNTTSATDTVLVSIDYAKTATIKRYQIDNGPMLDYVGTFDVSENCVITAYNEDSLGNSSVSQYRITNITTLPRYTILDKGSYFIIKLNYPSVSTPSGREYKWKPDGEWKTYNPNGILLIKPEYKDELISEDGVKIIEDGKEIIFTDHYYIVDVPLNELMENLFMRWDTAKPALPTYIPSTTDPTRELRLGINYDKTMVKKLYKVVTPDGKDTGWLEYNGALTIKDNGTVVYAKQMNFAEVWSQVSSYKVTNIDNINPEVNVKGDFITPKQVVTIQIIGTDNLKVDRVGYEKGIKDVNYFEENGNFINNNGVFKVTENGKYTVYVEDAVGNKVVKVIEVTNIDKTAPNIIINLLTEEYGTEAKVEIDYGDSKTKQYKIGEASTSYINYSDILTIKANDVLNLVNEDGSLTIYAKGIDEAGNEQIVSERINVLDLDAPKIPVIHAGAGYPVLTEYGVKLGSDSYIVYDNRDDITNYYSIDGGNTWKVYTGPFEITSGTILAKSVKKVSGLTITSSKKVDMPSDALPPAGYDGKNETYIGRGTYFISVSKELENQNVAITFQPSGTTVYGPKTIYVVVTMLDADGNILNTVTLGTEYSKTELVNIEPGTKKLKIENRYAQNGYGNNTALLQEIQTFSKAVISNQKFYPKLTEYGVEQGYNEVTIKYFQTSVKRLYRIDEGEWIEYKNKPIKLKLGEKIESLGIDKYGVETQKDSYVAVLPSDALHPNAYDKKNETYLGVGTYFIDVSSELENQNIAITFQPSGTTVYGPKTIYVVVTMLDADGNILNTVTLGTEYSKTELVNIEPGTIKLKIENRYAQNGYGNNSALLQEIQQFSKAVISNQKFYPELTEDGVEQGYNEVTIKYFQTSVQKLYRIDEGEWIEYKNRPIKLKLGEKIESLGIDKYGVETQKDSYVAVLPSDALGVVGYDEKVDTLVSTGTYFVNCSPGMENQNMEFIYSAGGTSVYGPNASMYVYMMNEDDKVLKQYSYSIRTTGATSGIAQIVDGTTKIKFYLPQTQNSYGRNTILLREIRQSLLPSIREYSKYPFLSYKGVEQSYNKIKINYLSYLINKKYSLDNGITWLDYEEPLLLEKGTKIIANATDKNGVTTGNSTYTVVGLSDDMPINAFDKDSETMASIPANNARVFNLSKDTYGKILHISLSAAPASNATIKMYDIDNKEISTSILNTQEEDIYIADSVYKVVVNAGSKVLSIKEISVEDKKVSLPKIESSTIDWSLEKNITITYPKGVTGEYSLDNGLTWNTYTTTIKVTKPLSVIARSRSGERILSSSSFTITKIDLTTPEITLELEDEIYYGTDIKIPTSFKVDNNKSGGSAKCTVDEKEITNIDSLPVGKQHIVCTATTGAGATATVVRDVNIIPETEFEGEGFLNSLAVKKLVPGNYAVSINGEEYGVHLYTFEGNQTWSTNQIFGTSEDVATATDEAKNMVVVKVNGDLTIDENVTVEPYYDPNYGGPKGFMLYVTGTLTNNGNVDNSHGAKATGQNVYLWKNADGTYEYVPAVGGKGGPAVSGTRDGIGGENGVSRQTGGGGSAHVYSGTSLAGGNGTSYSGGSGGGGGDKGTGQAGSSVGGAGGSAVGSGGGAGGGAGNPGGTSIGNGVRGQNGTGGLLVIYSNVFVNNGKISANGSNGGTGNQGGGSSGGGSINIFYGKSYEENGIVEAKGGISARYGGGVGGTGCITITKIM